MKSQNKVLKHCYPGFTLVETMTAITLSTILILMIFQSGLFTNRVVKLWLERFEFKQTTSLIYRRINNDLEKKGFELQTDSVRFYVRHPDISTPLYEFKESCLYRNGKLINQDKLRIGSLNLIFTLREFDSDTIIKITSSEITVRDTLRLVSVIKRSLLEGIGISFVISDDSMTDTIRIFHAIRPDYYDTPFRNYGIKYLRELEI